MSQDKLSHLPPPNTERWVVRRKAQVVTAVENGVLTFDEACLRYKISANELMTWTNLFRKKGTLGLRVTRTQKYLPQSERI